MQEGTQVSRLPVYHYRRVRVPAVRLPMHLHVPLARATATNVAAASRRVVHPW